MSFPGLLSPLRTPGDCLNKLNFLKILQKPFKMGKIRCSFPDTKNNPELFKNAKTLNYYHKLKIWIFLKL